MGAAWRMRALCLAGRIILENGGETYRAEDTVMHMARALGLSEPDVFGVPSGLFISYTDEAGERQTSVTRVFLHGTHLARVDAVNQISRRLSAGALAPETLLEKLQEAERLGAELSIWHPLVAALLTAAGFAVMFGGGPIDMLMGGLCAALTVLVPSLTSRHDGGGMSSVLLGGVLCTLIPLLFHGLTGLGVTEAMIASAIMPLVPGLSMTNAVQDILRGDMVSGVAHGARGDGGRAPGGRRAYRHAFGGVFPAGGGRFGPGRRNAHVAYAHCAVLQQPAGGRLLWRAALRAAQGHCMGRRAGRGGLFVLLGHFANGHGGNSGDVRRRADCVAGRADRRAAA